MAFEESRLIYVDGVISDGVSVRSTSTPRHSKRIGNEVPSIEDMQAAFGHPDEIGEGFLATLDPTGVGDSLWLCAWDGATWWTLKFNPVS